MAFGMDRLGLEAIFFRLRKKRFALWASRRESPSIVVSAPTRNLAKPFAIAGIVLAEVYMVFTVLAPNLQGEATPLWAKAARVAALSIFFGPFGAAVGTGVGLLATGVLSLFATKTPEGNPPRSETVKRN